MVEELYALPGTFCVASDSHSNMYGGVGCLGTPVVRTDAAAIWATGVTWWQVPPVARCILKGKLREGVSGKDVIVALCAHFPNHVLNHAVEFEFENGSAESLSVEDRLTIANMTTEWGALVGLFPADGRTWSYLNALRSKVTPARKAPAEEEFRAAMSSASQYLTPDDGCAYAKTLVLDLSAVEPYASGPNTPLRAAPIREFEKAQVKIQKAYLVSCTNSRTSDIKAAAEVARQYGENAKVAPGVELYIAAASKNVQVESQSTGDWQTLLKLGAKPLPAGCGPCIGLGTGLLQDGEVGISATNRNFKGRMGSKHADVYLASPGKFFFCLFLIFVKTPLFPFPRLCLAFY
jgi:homoaconitate hydratase